MRKALSVAIVLAMTTDATGHGAVVQTDHAPCSQLVGLRLLDVSITDATAVEAATTETIRAAHCRVNGVIGSEIRFQLLLPDAWNHKFFMGGIGGFAGSVQNAAEDTVNQGYANVGTDTGHTGGPTDGSWALNNLERRVNFGYLAVHRTVEVAKAIIAAFYGSTATRSYFFGCSDGGRQAVMEAIRYPRDFDGIIAGAPALDWVGFAAEFLKDVQAAFPSPTAPTFTPNVIISVGRQVLAACDGLDGVKDGVIADPRACKIDVASLTGLTESQRSALRKIYGETRTKDGLRYPGQPFGGEDEDQGWPLWITGDVGTPNGLRYVFATEFFKYFIFDDPNWDYRTYDFTHYRKDTELASSYLNANDPNLDAFRVLGHKAILFHGWADAALTPLGTVEYYEQVEARDPRAPDYIRLFMLPGVLHCGGGPGPDTVDWTSAITDWVEKGAAPTRLVARKRAGGRSILSRPVCPYPQHAVYNGTGDTNDERSFTCKR